MPDTQRVWPDIRETPEFRKHLRDRLLLFQRGETSLGQVMHEMIEICRLACSADKVKVSKPRKARKKREP